MPNQWTGVDHVKRVWSHVEVKGIDECWPWTAGQDSKGYGVTRWNGKPTRAHRAIFETIHGIGSAGECIDHVRERGCKGFLCCNFTHMESTTKVVNSQRQFNEPRQFCVNGHEFTPENTYVRPDGRGRQCKQCARDRDREYALRRTAA